MKYILPTILFILVASVSWLSSYTEIGVPELLPVGAANDGVALPPAGIVVDMPDGTKASSLQARLDLVTDRDLYVVVTQRTHADNRAVITANVNKNIVKVVNLSTNPSDLSLETRIRTEIPGTQDIFIHAWPK